jgi:hypothetical protein
MNGFEVSFKWHRICLFLFLLGVFYLLKGFDPIEIFGSILSGRSAIRIKLGYISIFVIGAFCVSMIDHYYGLFPRLNLRILYVIIGMILMIASYFFLISYKNVLDSFAMIP